MTERIKLPHEALLAHTAGTKHVRVRPSVYPHVSLPEEDARSENKVRTRIFWTLRVLL